MFVSGASINPAKSLAVVLCPSGAVAASGCVGDEFEAFVGNVLAARRADAVGLVLYACQGVFDGGDFFKAGHAQLLENFVAFALGCPFLVVGGARLDELPLDAVQARIELLQTIKQTFFVVLPVGHDCPPSGPGICGETLN